MTNPRQFLILLILGLAAVLLPAQPVPAQEATVTDLTVANSDSELLVYFTVENCFPEEIIAGIHNGIPATFTFYVELFRVKKGWPDKKVIAHSFNHTLTYDTLKEEYRIVLSERGREVVTADPATARQRMAEVNGFRAIPLSRLSHDNSYRLKIKAKLAKKTLPLYFHYLVPFSSLWDFETDWFSLEFSY